MNDFSGTIKYESLLKSLIEHKFTAIKRDCALSDKRSNAKTLLKRWRAEKESASAGRQRGDLMENASVDVSTQVAGSASECLDVAEERVIQSEKASCTSEDANSEDAPAGVVADEAPKPDEQVAPNDGAISKPILSARRSSGTSRRTGISTPAVEFSLEQEQRSRLRVLEARSISAQCSPIFPRQSFDAPPRTAIPQRVSPRPNASEDSVSSSANTDSVARAADDPETPSCSTMAPSKAKRSSANESINNISSNSLRSKVNSNKLTSSDLASSGATSRMAVTPTATTMSSSTIHNVPANCISGRRKHHGSEESRKIRKFGPLSSPPLSSRFPFSVYFCVAHSLAHRKPYARTANMKINFMLFSNAARANLPFAE